MASGIHPLDMILAGLIIACILSGVALGIMSSINTTANQETKNWITEFWWPTFYALLVFIGFTVVIVIIKIVT